MFVELIETERELVILKVSLPLKSSTSLLFSYGFHTVFLRSCVAWWICSTVFYCFCLLSFTVIFANNHELYQLIYPLRHRVADAMLEMNNLMWSDMKDLLPELKRKTKQDILYLNSLQQEVHHSIFPGNDLYCIAVEGSFLSHCTVLHYNRFICSTLNTCTLLHCTEYWILHTECWIGIIDARGVGIGVNVEWYVGRIEHCVKPIHDLHQMEALDTCTTYLWLDEHTERRGR